MRFLPALLAIWVLTMVVSPKASADGVDYWVWHRSTPLKPEEQAQLSAQGVKTLYWHVGEMENRKDSWRWKAAPRPPESAEAPWKVVPVVRLTTEVHRPFPPETMPALVVALKAAASADGALQLDFDCPDRLLPSYAPALRQIREVVPHLSITALAHWPRLAGFRELTDAVEEIFPMFYDLQADPTGVKGEVPPPPLLDPQQLATVIRPWHDCPISWRAGLPAFARLTVFDSTGVTRGQIPNWSWDDVCFHRSLHALTSTYLGGTLFRVDAETKIADTPVGKDEMIASRFTDRQALIQSASIVRGAGAQGIVLFRLPDGSDPGGWSLRDLSQLDAARRIKLIVRQTPGEQLELINDSAVDLPPRLAGDKGDRDRGYALEIDAPAPVFREALAGDFWQVNSHAEPDLKKPVAVAVPLATRLTFWFSHLPAGAALRTGLLQLAPGVTLTGVRYRILNCEGADPWQPIQPAPSAAPVP